MSDKTSAGAPCPSPWRWRLAGLIASACLGLVPAATAKLETWRQEGANAFGRHRRDRIVISDQGRARLGRSLVNTGLAGAERVWDLARDRQGSIYAATGDSGKVFRRGPEADAAWALVLDAADSQALSLVATPGGKVFVGTGPSGQVVEISDPKHPASRPDPKVQYVWDLAGDDKGNVYAATGPGGQLWKRDEGGKWSMLLDSKATHLLCVAVGGDGSVYAGSDGEGLIYRVAPDLKVSVLYDAPQSEVRSLLVAPDGSLYAATAVEAAGGGAGGRSTTVSNDGDGGRRPIARTVLSGPPGEGAIRIQGQAQAPSRPRGLPQGPQGGSAAPKPVTAGENAVYRLEPDGVVREVFRAKALFFALAWSQDRLLIGTGPEGQLYEVRQQGLENTPLARLDTGQVLSLLAEPDGNILLGTGDPGSVVRLAPDHVARGELTSEVHDTRLISRFGALSWRSERPEGTSIALQVRSGNVGEPDETWSGWSAEQTDPQSSRAVAPPGRFVQYRAILSTTDPSRTPELTAVSLSHRSLNLPPEIGKLDVPDVTTADGSSRQARVTLRWEVSDPNDDEMTYAVQVQKEGWPAWIALTDSPLTEKSLAWDTLAFPSGHYRIKVVASDRPSNSPDEALTRDRESQVFVVDHDPPGIAAEPRDGGADVVLTDRETRLVKAEYALDGGPWTPLFPDDGLFDSTRERVTIRLADLKAGPHLLMVRATDAAGNVAAADTLLKVGK